MVKKWIQNKDITRPYQQSQPSIKATKKWHKKVCSPESNWEGLKNITGVQFQSGLKLSATAFFWSFVCYEVLMPCVNLSESRVEKKRVDFNNGTQTETRKKEGDLWGVMLPFILNFPQVTLFFCREVFIQMTFLTQCKLFFECLFYIFEPFWRYFQNLVLFPWILDIFHLK